MAITIPTCDLHIYQRASREEIGRGLIQNVILISPYHNHFIIYLKSQVSNKSLSCPAVRCGSPFKIYRISISALERVWYGIRITPLGNMVLQALSVSYMKKKHIFTKYMIIFIITWSFLYCHWYQPETPIALIETNTMAGNDLVIICLSHSWICLQG